MNKFQKISIGVLVFLYAFALCFSAAKAQDIVIPLQDTTIKVKVNKLLIRPIGAPYMFSFTVDTTVKALAQDVYYQLIRPDGKAGEQGNKTIPMQMYTNGFNYITNTVTPSVLSTINFFFQAADWPELIAKMPE